MALALHGGEDYALVVALPAGEALEGFARIGEILAAEGGPPLAIRGEDGTVAAAPAGGFDHFAG